MYIYMLYTCDVLSFYVYNLYCTLCKCLRSLYKYFFDISNHTIYFPVFATCSSSIKTKAFYWSSRLLPPSTWVCSFPSWQPISSSAPLLTPASTLEVSTRHHRLHVHACISLYPDYMYMYVSHCTRLHVPLVYTNIAYMYVCRGLKSHPRQFIFLRKSDCLGCTVLLCLVVCLTLLASFFLPSHLSLKHVLVSVIYKYIVYILYISDLEKLLLSYYTSIYMHVQYNVALF